jgi:proline racemase
VTVECVPSFVHTAGLPLRIGTRHVSVDIAFGGELYAIADSEAIGIPVEMANAAALVRMGRDIRDELHPIDIQGTIFTGAPHASADLRSATVLDGEVLRRSPGVTGTAAMMAVLDAMGVLIDDGTFVHEGILGTTLQGRLISRKPAAAPPAVIPVIEGSASITGFHEFVGD